MRDPRPFALRAAEFWLRWRWPFRVLFVMLLAVGFQSARAEAWRVVTERDPACPDTACWLPVTPSAWMASQAAACALDGYSEAWRVATSRTFLAPGIWDGVDRCRRDVGDPAIGPYSYTQLEYSATATADPPPPEPAPQVTVAELSLIVGASLVFGLGVLVTR